MERNTMRIPVLLFVISLVDYIHPQINPFTGHSYREFGGHVKGEVLSYTFKGYIPLFHPIYRVIVKPQRLDVNGNFTYLKVEYINRYTDIFVLYNATANLVTFRLKYPFIKTPFEITGYSMLEHTSSNRSKWHLPGLYELINYLTL